MRLAGVASLTDALLVVKGGAAPSRPAPPAPRRSTPSDGYLRVGVRLDERCECLGRRAAAATVVPLNPWAP